MLTDVVFLASRFPYPLDKGDKLRVYHQLKGLSGSCRVHLIAINNRSVPESDLQELQSFCASVTVFVLPLYKRIFQLLISPLKRLPLQVAFFYNPGIRKRIEHVISSSRFETVHCHSIRMTEYVRKLHGIRTSIDFMDAFGKGMERRELATGNFLKRLVFRYEKKQLYRYEQSVFSFIDRFCIISEQDKQAIKSDRTAEIEVIPNGVDFNAFQPQEREKRYDLVFMGNMSYPPNIDAVTFLCNEILPLIRKQLPEVTLLIAGGGATRAVRKLQSDSVAVRADFDHISESMAISRLMLAPMKLSIGLQNKIVQAMAMEVPCVVSRLSNNAIRAPHPGTIREAETPAEFAAHVMDLLANPDKAQQMAKSALSFVQEQYSWSEQNEKLIRLTTHA